MNISVELPLAIESSEEFRSLDESQRLSLLRRLDNARALGVSLASGKRFQESDDFLDFVEDLELDVSLVQELDGAPQGGLTRWQIHYSWTFETSPSKMFGSLDAETVKAIDFHEPSLDAEIEDYKIWFKEVGEWTVGLIDKFSGADGFDSAMALLVALDVMLGRLLIACYKLRINEKISR